MIGKTNQNYRQELARSCAYSGFGPRGSEAAEANEVKITDLASLQSDGPWESGNAIKEIRAAGLTNAQLLGRSHAEEKTPNPLSPEAKAVLTQVNQEINKRDAGDYLLYLDDIGSDQLTGTALRLNSAKQVERAYEVGIHTTPGVPGGLLFLDDVTGSALDPRNHWIDSVNTKLATTHFISLSDPEQGWKQLTFGGGQSQVVSM